MLNSLYIKKNEIRNYVYAPPVNVQYSKFHSYKISWILKKKPKNLKKWNKVSREQSVRSKIKEKKKKKRTLEPKSWNVEEPPSGSLYRHKSLHWKSTVKYTDYLANTQWNSINRTFDKPDSGLNRIFLLEPNHVYWNSFDIPEFTSKILIFAITDQSSNQL